MPSEPVATAATLPDPMAVGSGEDSESEPSQKRLWLDLLERLFELVKGCIYFGDVLYASAIPETQRKR